MNFSIVEQYFPVLTKPKVFFPVPNFPKDAPLQRMLPLQINLALGRLRAAYCAGKNMKMHSVNRALMIKFRLDACA